MAFSLRFLIALFFLCEIISCNNPAVRNTKNGADTPDAVLAGRKIFESICVRCHGMDASGLTGPSLKRQKLLHAPDIVSFTSVVEQGIIGTGMPGNWALSDTDCHQVYAYISSLKNQDREIPPGDSASGEHVFAINGCANCHIVNGNGISIGPELSQIGAVRNAAYLRQSILDPGAALPESTDPDNGYGFSLYLPVKVVTAEGKEITGLRMNEDTYTIQLKDISNNYFSFNKEKLTSIEKQYGRSLMPEYNSKLTDKQKEDLVAYLSKLGNQ